MNRSALALVGLVLAVTLSGCYSAGRGDSNTGRARAATGFMESASVKGVQVTLMVEPLQIGENRFVVLLDDPATAGVEIQAVMATMGHGIVVDLREVEPGRFEATSGALTMNGPWLIRVVATPEAGENKDTTFRLEL